LEKKLKTRLFGNICNIWSIENSTVIYGDFIQALTQGIVNFIIKRFVDIKLTGTERSGRFVKIILEMSIRKHLKIFIKNYSSPFLP